MSSSGLVTAKGVGTAKITAKSASSKDEETCTITVTSPEIKVTSISLNKTSLSMQTGEYETLKATVKPDNATDKSVTWSSSNNSVATVNTTGKVAAISAGSATITCKANDGSGKQATCTITVTDAEVKVTNITLNKTSLSLQTGEYETLTATVKPDNATDKSVKWSSDKTSVATIDNYGKVTAKSEGTATITCTANDGSGVSASCSITVTDPEPESADIWFVSVTCDNADPNNLTQNDKLQMHATFMNKGATAEIYTMLALIDTKESKIVAHGDFDHRDFKGGEQTTVAYEYALDTIPAGNYEATVLYFDWNDEMWIYGGEDFLYNITVKESGRKGDLTGDGEVNGTDLVALTNMILGKSTKTATADVNGDGEVNGTDYVALVNIILGRASARKAEDSTPRNGINILNIKKIIKK